MKRRISYFLLILAVSLTFLTGCFGSSTDIQGDIDHKVGDTYSGVLKIQTGLYADLPGTHFLEIDGGKKLPLSSLAINLSDSKYLNKQVEVTGLKKESSNSEEFLEVESIKLLGSDVTEGSWEVYKSDTLGFKIAYKNNWTIDESAKDQIVFTSPDTSSEKVVVAKKAADKDADLKTTAIKFYGSKAEQATSSKVGKDGMDALKMSADKDHDVIYVFKRYEWAYLVTFDGSTDNTDLDNKNTFNQMMLDFQFLPITGENLDTTSVDAATSTITDLSEANKAVLGTLQKSPSNFSSDLPSDFAFLRAEFVGDNYVFVEFKTGEAKQRYLFNYSYSNKEISNVTTTAKYKQGSTTDWELTDGNNPVLGKEKTVVNFKSSGEISVSKLKAGFRYFESDKYKFKMQYPAGWYYAGSSDKDGYHFGFSNKPVEADNELVSVNIAASSDKITKPEVSLSDGGAVVKIDGFLIKFAGSDLENLKIMAQSVEML